MVIKNLLDRWNRSRPLFEIFTGAEVKHLASYWGGQIKRHKRILDDMSRAGREKESKFDILQQEQRKMQNNLDYINDNIAHWFTPTPELKNEKS